MPGFSHQRELMQNVRMPQELMISQTIKRAGQIYSKGSSQRQQNEQDQEIMTTTSKKVSKQGKNECIVVDIVIIVYMLRDSVFI